MLEEYRRVGEWESRRLANREKERPQVVKESERAQEWR